MDDFLIVPCGCVDEKSANKALSLLVGLRIVPFGVIFGIGFGPIAFVILTSLSIGLTWVICKLIKKVLS